MTENTDIRNREDIDQFLILFYGAARQEPRLGPIFNTAIPEGSWPGHLEKIGNFWETILFHKAKYQGAPIPAHIELDKEMPLDKDLFERWLALFRKTVDEHYAGPVAEEAKKRADLMVPLMLFKVESARRPGFIQ
jgi:hemoglobin